MRAVLLATLCVLFACGPHGATPPAPPSAHLTPGTAPPAPLPHGAATPLVAPTSLVAPTPGGRRASAPAAVRTGHRSSDDFLGDIPTFELADPQANEQLAAAVEAATSRVERLAGAPTGACRATLASVALVSVLCDTADADGELALAVTFRIEGSAVLRLSPDEALVPGSSIERAVCAVAAAATPPETCEPREVVVALGADRFVARIVRRDAATRRSRARRIDVPYAEVAAAIRPDGPLGHAAGVAPQPPTPASLAVGTAEPATAYGEPRALEELAGLLLRTHGDAMSLVAAGEGLYRPATRTAAPVAAHERSWGAAIATSWPAAQETLRVTTVLDAGFLRRAPREASAGPAHVSEGLPIAVLDGLESGYDSFPIGVAETTWVYAMTLDGKSGWLRTSSVDTGADR